ncbi:MAG: glycosyltransferase family 4 protein [Deltaproteobacteria bacterium]|nr:glycosyltransferase family 4 protein [Deltaproteobacteria bacterium]HDZ23106.1 glycosyltransferase family 1 protein [Desulfobacteraceae bacterium]
MNRPIIKPSRIAFITDAITQNHAGIGRYASNIFRELSISGNVTKPVDWRKREYLSHLPSKDRLSYVRIHNGWPCFKTLLWHMTLIRALEQFSSEFDIVFNPSQFLHLVGNLSVPYVYVVHDLSFFSFPECHKHGKKILFGLLFEHTLKNADCIVCVSRYTRDELLKRYPLLEKRVKVVHEAAEEKFRPIRDVEALTIVRKKYDLPARFLLFVGTVEPRKNLETVFLAYDRFKEQIPLPFYIAGKPGWRSRRLLRLHERLRLKSRIRFMGYIPDDELPVLYNLATALVYLSRDEGFGLPPLEAMQCGTPVMVSNAGSLPEITGDAALVISGDDPEIVGKNLQTLCKDGELRRHLREKGLERAGAFSWKKTGESLEVLFQELSGQHRNGRPISTQAERRLPD